MLTSRCVCLLGTGCYELADRDFLVTSISSGAFWVPTSGYSTGYFIHFEWHEALCTGPTVLVSTPHGMMIHDPCAWVILEVLAPKAKNRAYRIRFRAEPGSIAPWHEKRGKTPMFRPLGPKPLDRIGVKSKRGC